MSEIDFEKITPRLPKKLIENIDAIVNRENEKKNLKRGDKLSRNRVIFIWLMKGCAHYDATGEIE